MKVTLLEFYALHQLLVIEAFGNEDILQQKSNSQIYGLNDYKERNHTLSGKMENVLREKVNGRALHRYKVRYNKLLDRRPYQKWKISDKHYDQYLRYLGVKNIEEVKKRYFEKTGKEEVSFVPPRIVLKSRSFGGSTTGSFPGYSRIIHNNLQRISLSENWWLYFYEYRDSDESKGIRKVMRILFKFKPAEDQVTVQYLNTGPAYTDFFGRVVGSSEGILICALQGAESIKKQLYLIFTVEKTGKKDLYTGIYLKHDSLHKIYAGTVILQRIKETEYPNPEAKVLPLDKWGKNSELPLAIGKFFEKKRYSFLKTPRIFNLEDLEDWIIKKKGSRGEINDYHLFIAAPIMSFAKQVKNFHRLKAALLKRIKNKSFYKQLDNPEKEELEREIIEVLSEESFEDPNMDLSEDAFKKLNRKVQGIEEMLADEYGFKIYYSRSKDRFSFDNYFPHPTQILSEDLEAIKSSRAFLLVCPYSSLFSSCWVQVGWAMTLGIPVFILCRSRKNLTFILTASNWHQHKVEIIKMNLNLEVSKILNYLNQNAFWRQTFEDLI